MVQILTSALLRIDFKFRVLTNVLLCTGLILQLLTNALVRIGFKLQILKNALLQIGLILQILAKNNHTSNKCLKTSDPITRKHMAKQKLLCFLCLNKGHSAVSCKLKYSCNKCGGKHNIAICYFSKDKTNPSRPVSTADVETSTNFSTNKNNILLQAASVSVCGVDNNKLDNVPLLFGCGSQRSYVSDKLKKQLKLLTLRSEKSLLTLLASKSPSLK